MVTPELDLVVVVTGNIHPRDKMLPMQYQTDFIWKAVRSNQSLPPNPGANRKLQTLLQSLEHPTKGKIWEPPFARHLSGKRAVLEGPSDREDFREFSLSFGDAKTCRFRTKTPRFAGFLFKTRGMDIEMGLDGRFRTQPVRNYIGDLPVFGVRMVRRLLYGQ